MQQKAAGEKDWASCCATAWAMMHYFNQNFTGWEQASKNPNAKKKKNLSLWQVWYFCLIKKERGSSTPYTIWLLHWWNYLSWNKLICLSGTQDNLITQLSKVRDYVSRNWQLIITHNSCQGFGSVQEKIDGTQSKLGTVIHSKLWWELAYVRGDKWKRFRG